MSGPAAGRPLTVVAARPWLWMRGVLLLVAFDLWLTRVPHAGRYGAGGFNVAHAPWIDAVQPPISPELYVAVALGAGLLAFSLALAPTPSRPLLALLAALHTWSWAMSMLDSYQHHYLLSLVLVSFVAFPRLDRERALAGGPARVEPGGYAVLLLGLALVYAYAAFSKTSPEWLAGEALADLAGRTEAFRTGARAALALGLEPTTYRWALGHGVVALQLGLAGAYLLAPVRDERPSRAGEVLAGLALAVGVAFHLGTELLDLQIGWFSAYMVGAGLITFLPGRAVQALAAAVTPGGVAASRGRPVRAELPARIGLGALAVGVGGWVWAPAAWAGALLAATALGEAALRRGAARLVDAPTSASAEPGPRQDAWLVGAWALSTVGAGAAAVSLVALAVPLPGAGATAIALALGLAIVAGLAIGRPSARPAALGAAGAALLGAASLAVALATTPAVFDYYRNVGGDRRRRGDLAGALAAYRLANRHAPPPVVARAGPERLPDGRSASLSVTSEVEGSVQTLRARVEVDHPAPATLGVELEHRWPRRGGDPPEAWATRRVPLRWQGDAFGGPIEAFARTPAAGLWIAHVRDPEDGVAGQGVTFRLEQRQDRRRAEEAIASALREQERRGSPGAR